MKHCIYHVGCALFLCALVTAAQAGTTYIYTPETINSISGRVYADAGCPTHLLNMSSYGCTSSALSQNITGWNLGDFTGVTSPTPLGTYQRGIQNSQYGCTSVQMTGTQVGTQLHTWSIPGGSGYMYDLANVQVKYTWDDDDTIYPWAHTTSNFKFSFYLRIPQAYVTGGAVGYVYADILVKDNNNKYFWLQPIIYDTRGAPDTEYVGWDAGTSSAYANTFYDYANATDYCSKHPASYWSTGSTWNQWRWYCFTVNRTQLLNAIGDINSNYGAGLSTDPAQWRLIMFAIQNEMYWPTGNGNLSFGADGIWVLEEY